MLREYKNIENVQTEIPVTYDSQSNGGTEVGVRLVRGLFRSLKLCRAARLNRYIPVNHALMTWLLQHTCMLLNARARSSDGLTAWQRVKGRSFNKLVLGFSASACSTSCPPKAHRATQMEIWALVGRRGCSWSSAARPTRMRSPQLKA